MAQRLAGISMRGAAWRISIAGPRPIDVRSIRRGGAFSTGLLLPEACHWGRGRGKDDRGLNSPVRLRSSFRGLSTGHSSQERGR
jgi:hypothetical protein